jgi:hypothetical protein
MRKNWTINKIIICLLVFLIGHFFYWHLFVYLNLKDLKSGVLETKNISFIAEEGGDDIIYGDKVFKDVRPGDIIFRPVAWTETDGIYTKYSLKFFTLGIPGNAEHSSLYLGDGKIINIAPARKDHSIFTGPVEDTIGYYPAEKIEIMRITSDPAIIKKAIDFINFHQSLEREKKTGFIKNITTIKKIRLKEPLYFNNSRFDYYLSGFNCNYIIVYAYEYGGYGGFREIEKPWYETLFYLLSLHAFPSKGNIKAFSENIVYSGDDIKKHAIKIITARQNVPPLVSEKRLNQALQ